MTYTRSTRPSCLASGKLKDGLDALLLGTFNKATSIDDDHRCGVHRRVVRDIKIIGLELAHQDLRVKGVLGAAEGDHMRATARRSSGPHEVVFSEPKDSGNNESINSMALNT